MSLAHLDPDFLPLFPGQQGGEEHRLGVYPDPSLANSMLSGDSFTSPDFGFSVCNNLTSSSNNLTGSNEAEMRSRMTPLGTVSFHQRQ